MDANTMKNEFKIDVYERVIDIGLHKEDSKKVVDAVLWAFEKGVNFEKEQTIEADEVTADFPIIKLGFGEVEVGDAMHEDIPALWFGRNGRGLDAPEKIHNRPAYDGETLALFTFADIRGLEAIEKACARVRAEMTKSQ